MVVFRTYKDVELASVAPGDLNDRRGWRSLDARHGRADCTARLARRTLHSWCPGGTRQNRWCGRLSLRGRGQRRRKERVTVCPGLPFLDPRTFATGLPCALNLHLTSHHRSHCDVCHSASCMSLLPRPTILLACESPLGRKANAPTQCISGSLCRYMTIANPSLGVTVFSHRTDKRSVLTID